QWSARTAGPLRAWPGLPDLAARVDDARRLLTAAAAAGVPLPADPTGVALADLPALAERAGRAGAALTHRRQRERLSAEGLEELAAAVPAGAGEDDVARLVRAAWLRARTEAAVADLLAGGAPGELAAAFRDADASRRRAAARRLRSALSDPAAAPRVRVVAGAAELADGEEFDVLLVDDVQRRPAEDVLALARRARQLVAVGTAEGTGTGDGSAWSALAAALVPHALAWPPAPAHAPTAALRDAVATALRAAGLPVTDGAPVAGHPVDLLVARDPDGDGPALALELDGAPWRALPTVRDREVARPEQLQRAGLAVHRVWSTAWFRDPRGEVQRVVEAWRRAEQERAEQERAEQERAEQERAEQERAEQERAEQEQAEQEQAEQEQAEVLAREEAERVAREEAERAAQQEAERAAQREQAELLAREEAERAAREEAERVAREQAERAPAEEVPQAGADAGPVAAPTVPEPPAGLGSAAGAQATVDGFTAGLGGAHPNVDQTPVEAVDAAVALAYARLGTTAQDTAVLDAAMDVLGFRRRGVKVQRAFKESVQRAKKRMRGAGIRIQ
ncbi:hypothetical protein, partial [Kineococcus indalonis]|uniref:hypothetical protein n=1 Tax=Kineococcus indalonis TaxID=2696566 RepID=UPI00196AE270